MDRLKNIEKAIPSVGSAAKTIIGGIIGAGIAKKGSGFSKSETTNRMVDRNHAANVEDEMKNRDHSRDLKKGQQFHNQNLEAKRFEADTVHEFATKYPHATEIVHGGTKIKFGKREKSSSKPAAPAKAKKSGKGKTK